MVRRWWHLAYGTVRCGVVVAAWTVVALPVALVRGRRAFVGALPVLAGWLGPAYVKLAQLASTREDIVPAGWCRALARLREDGRPIRPRAVRRALTRHGLPGDGARLLGAGSVACVYLIDGGNGAAPVGGPFAVKVLRPRVRSAIARDLDVFRFGARCLARLPRLRHVPVVDMVDHIAEAIAGQVDLARERDNLETLRGSLDPDKVHVPAARAGGSTDLLVMDYLPIFDDREVPAADRRPAAEALVESVFRMLLTVGVVHCDLHPGNLRVAGDGRVCLVDAGFVVTTDTVLRRQFCEFFLGLSLGNGPRCAKSILDAALVTPATFDQAAFDAEVTDIVHRYTGRAAADFSIAEFVDELFALQRRHQVFVSAAFVVPILTLLVIEGTVRSWHPALDFQTLAQPIVLSALARLPKETRAQPNCTSSTMLPLGSRTAK